VPRIKIKEDGCRGSRAEVDRTPSLNLSPTESIEGSIVCSKVSTKMRVVEQKCCLFVGAVPAYERSLLGQLAVTVVSGLID